MQLYISHATSFNYQDELYQPLKNSPLSQHHQLILPHEQSAIAKDSKALIRNSDFIIAEVSYPSTGQGIELGWANLLEVPVICVHKVDKNYSSAIKVIAKVILPYSDIQNLWPELKLIIKS